MKKTWILLVISVLCLALFTSCASTADTLPSPSPSASVSPSAAPVATQGPTVSISPTNSTEPTAEGGVNTVEDAKRVSDSVAEEVEKLSELDTAEAVVAGNIALVGIKYDGQYQGGLTERLIEMVEARVEAIDKTITAVHVTDDEGLVQQIGELRKKLNDGGITFEELQTQMLDVGSAITGGSDAPSDQPQATTGA